MSSSLCFGEVGWFTLGSGQCTAAPVAGAFDVSVDGTGFATEQVAGVVDGSYVEIVARSGERTIALLLPSAPGTYDCASTGFGGVVSYFETTTRGFFNRITSPRPACTVTITSVGPVGGRIVGSFSATVAGTAASVQLGAGTFNVERAAFP